MRARSESFGLRFAAVCSWAVAAAACSTGAIGGTVSTGIGLTSDSGVDATGVVTPDGAIPEPTADGSADAVAKDATPDVGTPLPPGKLTGVDVTIDVTANVGAHSISPYIYGVNDGGKASAAHATIVRSGGNRLTAFNWETNASNAGSDYSFENDDFLCSGTKCVGGNDAPGGYLMAVVAGASAARAAALLTVPIVDYVAADKGPGGDVRSSGSDYLAKRFARNQAAKGAAFSDPPNVTDGVVSQDEMVAWVHAHAGTTEVRYLLDNEPDLWSATHAEVHPTAVTYAELASRCIAYATAIKAVVPSAHVSGPASYGWTGYVSLQGASDVSGDFIEAYLDAMKAAESAAGKRLVDALDLHWYPEAMGDGQRIVVAASSPGLVTAREQAPRSLWDSAYVEDSWIAKSSLGSKAIALVPRMLGKIAAHYPATGLSFSEWNYGGGGDISGAIATADVLGIFGAYGVEMAMLWPMNPDESYTYAAFNAFRNYDGKGGAFGDVSIGATSTDILDATAYASLDSTAVAKVVIVVLNKALVGKVAGIVVHHSVSYKTANVYTLTAAGGATLVAGAPLAAVDTNAFRYSMPAQSISVIVPTP